MEKQKLEFYAAQLDGVDNVVSHLGALLLAALPYVEEGESYNKPERRNLSKEIRYVLKQIGEI